MRLHTLAAATIALTFVLSVTAKAQRVQEWLTTADKAQLFARQHDALRMHATPAGTTSDIAVDPTQRYQSMDGFGFALTGGSAELMMKMTPAARRALMQNLFATRHGGIGTSYLRISIGSSDMNEHVFTYDDMPQGETDPTLAHFALGPDLQDIVPVLHEVLKLQPNLSILASPWSAPSWMKTNGLPKGGSLEPRWYAAYADYLVRYIEAMQQQGIHIRAITMQNEPLNPHNTPSMVMTAKEQAEFLGKYFGPALKKAHLDTEVILYDHNCDRPDYPLDILADPVAAAFATGSGFHLYGGEITAMTKVHDAHPDKGLYFTEQMTIQKADETPFHIAESVSRLMIGAPRNWAKNVLLWNLAADPQFGPHTPDGGCPICQGAVTIDGNNVTRNLAFYTVAHASLLVRPGSVRIASTIQDAHLPNVAFTTPAHKTVLIVANTDTRPHTFVVMEGRRSFETTLGGGDVATYQW